MLTKICNTCTRSTGSFRYATKWSPNSYQQIRGLRLYQERTVRLMYWRGRSFDRVKYDMNRRSQRLDWNYRAEIYAFSRRLHENLDEDSLRQVFTHPSYVEELRETQERLNLPDTNIQSNEHMVEKGRQLLDQCLKRYLRCTFNRMPEDGIVQITNYLASDKVLADIAKWIGCKDIILAKEYPPKEKTMADTVKALIAAIQSEQPGRTQRFVVDIIISYLNDKDLLDDVWIIPNPKETLNLILANSQLPAYEPRIMFETGVKTLEQCYVVGLYSNQKFLGSSAGETLKIAENCAALDALQNLFDLKEDRPPYVYGDASDKIDYSNYEKENDCIKRWHLKLV